MSKISLGMLAAAAIFMCTIAPAAGQRNGGVADLPDGPGKEVVAQECTKCHGLNNITNSWGFSEKEWRETFDSMVKLPDDKAKIIAAYLGKTFPEKPDRPKTVVVPGDLKVNIREWVAPTLGSRPHDPQAAADGTIYWAGMWGNVIGHVDPKTNAIKEYPLPTTRTGPHGLTMDKEGNVWYAGNFGGLIGKLNPKTGEVKEYKMPGPGGARSAYPRLRQEGHALVHVAERQHGWPIESGDRRNQACEDAPGAVTALRPGDDVGRQPVHLRVRGEPSRKVRHRHDGDHGIRAAQSDVAPASFDDHARRRRLLRGLFARLSRDVQPEDEGIEGVAVTERSEVAAVRHRLYERRRLV
jgi:hypothetical protein